MPKSQVTYYFTLCYACCCCCSTNKNPFNEAKVFAIISLLCEFLQMRLYIACLHVYVWIQLRSLQQNTRRHTNIRTYLHWKKKCLLKHSVAVVYLFLVAIATIGCGGTCVVFQTNICMDVCRFSSRPNSNIWASFVACLPAQGAWPWHSIHTWVHIACTVHVRYIRTYIYLFGGTMQPQSKNKHFFLFLDLTFVCILLVLFCGTFINNFRYSIITLLFVFLFGSRLTYLFSWFFCVCFVVCFLLL